MQSCNQRNQIASIIDQGIANEHQADQGNIARIHRRISSRWHINTCHIQFESRTDDDRSKRTEQTDQEETVNDQPMKQCQMNPCKANVKPGERFCYKCRRLFIKDQVAKGKIIPAVFNSGDGRTSQAMENVYETKNGIDY